MAKEKNTFPKRRRFERSIGTMVGDAQVAQRYNMTLRSLTECYSEIVRSVVNKSDSGESQSKNSVLKETPERAAKAMLELCCQEPFVMTVFEEEGANEMVLQQGIRIKSLCEHHMLPFFGTVAIAYIPWSGRVLGLSKLSRLARWAAGGLNTQERITRRILDVMNAEPLSPAGVAVSIRCYHTCMSLRGVEDCGANTITQAFAGAFETGDPRAEFLSLVKHSEVYQ